MPPRLACHEPCRAHPVGGVDVGGALPAEVGVPQVLAQVVLVLPGEALEPVVRARVDGCGD